MSESTQFPPLMRIRAVVAAVGVSRASIYEWIARGEFPRPVRLGSQSVAWRGEEVAAWIASRERAA